MVREREREREREGEGEVIGRKETPLSIMKHLPLPLFASVLLSVQPQSSSSLISSSLTGFTSTLETIKEEIKVIQKINRISAKKLSDSTK